MTVPSKPMASLNAGLLGNRATARRVPLSFAPAADDPLELAEVPRPEVPRPEVHRQVERLALALGAELAGSEPDAAPAPRRRIACTVRLDPVRHGRLRQLAMAQACSAQVVLVEAFDRYHAALAAAQTNSVTAASPHPRSSGITR